MARFARQNESFCATKWTVFVCKMGRFESRYFVKKRQVLCFQPFTTFSYFACTRPPDFYFRKWAFSEAHFAFFVSKIQQILSVRIALYACVFVLF
jgi:hypothetical protein